MKRLLVVSTLAVSAVMGAAAACSNFSGTDTGSAGGDAGVDDANADAAATNADGSTASDGGGSDGGQGADGAGAEASANDAGPGGDLGIRCNGSTCEAGAEVCCTNGGIRQCLSQANEGACQAFTVFECDDWLDCAPSGKVCCGTKTSDPTNYYQSSCTTLAGCPTVGDAVVCALGAANACPNGAICQRADGGNVGFCVGLP